MNSPSQTKRPSTFRMYRAACKWALGSTFGFGYNMMLTNPAQDAYQQFVQSAVDLPDSLKGFGVCTAVAIAVFFLGTIIGGFIIAPLGENLGRKKAFTVGVAIKTVACLMHIAGFMMDSYWAFFVGRITMGAGCALSMGMSSILVTECSPSTCSGKAPLVNAVFLQSSLLLGSIVALPELLGTIRFLKYLYCIQLVLNVIVMCWIQFLPETPVYLSRSTRRSDIQLSQVTEAIIYYHDVNEQQAKKMAAEMIKKNSKTVQKLNLYSVWLSDFTRQGTFSGIIINIAMTMSGITIVNTYTVKMCINTGMSATHASYANIVLSLFPVLGVVTSFLVIDRWGRRKLLLGSFAALFCINWVIVVLLYICGVRNDGMFRFMLIGAVSMFNFFFAMGPGPLALFMSNELLPQSARTASANYNCLTMGLCRFITLATYRLLEDYTSDWFAYGFFFLVPLIAALHYLKKHLPETKGKTMGQLEAEFNKRNMKVDVDMETQPLANVTNEKSEQSEEIMQ